MGITTCAIVENRLGADKLGNLVAQLSSNSELATFMREFDTALRSAGLSLTPDLHAKLWQFTDDLDRYPECVRCIGPFGALTLHKNLAELSWYWCRWSLFLTAAKFRNPLYEATRVISAILSTGVPSTAIFLPDSSYDESRALDKLHGAMPELLAFLSQQCGPPAASLASIAKEPFKGYYIARWPPDSAGM